MHLLHARRESLCARQFRPIHHSYFITPLCVLGEFGQVYKGYVKTRYTTDIVAVKTLKGA